MENHSHDSLSYHFTSDKAGMEGLDREQIDKIVSDATKNTRIAKKREEEYEQVKQEASKLSSSLQLLHKNEILMKQIEQAANAKVNQLRSQRRLDRIWMHIDMDMYYAAIEIRDEPSYANLPLAVGSIQMISTSNYIARKFGVRSAMPGFIALLLCPKLKIIPGNYSKYSRESRKIMSILKKYDEDSEQMGLDEAYLDLTSYCHEQKATREEDIKAIVQKIKDEIFNETKLTSSCGIACNKTLSKICSDYKKPDGLFYLQFDYDFIENFMKDLNIRKIPFIGEKTEKKLNLLNIFKCEDIVKNYVDLFYLFESRFDFFYCGAVGIGNCEHEEQQESKSISKAASFKMTNDLTKINKTFVNLVRLLYDTMSRENVKAKTLTIMIIDSNERKTSKCITSERDIHTEEEILLLGRRIMTDLVNRTHDNGIRMIQLRVSGLNRLTQVDTQNLVNSWFNNASSKEDSIVNSLQKDVITNSNVSQRKISYNTTGKKSQCRIEQSSLLKLIRNMKEEGISNTNSSQLSQVKRKLFSVKEIPHARTTSDSKRRVSKRRSKLKNSTLDHFLLFLKTK